MSYLVFLLILSQTCLLKVHTPLTTKFCPETLSIVIFIPFLDTMLRVQIATGIFFFFFGRIATLRIQDHYFASYTCIFSVNIVSSNLHLWVLLISHQHVISGIWHMRCTNHDSVSYYFKTLTWDLY